LCSKDYPVSPTFSEILTEDSMRKEDPMVKSFIDHQTRLDAFPSFWNLSRMAALLLALSAATSCSTTSSDVATDPGASVPGLPTIRQTIRTGMDHPRMHRALSLLRAAEIPPPPGETSAPPGPGRINLLTAALELLKHSPEPNLGHHAKAIDLVASAIDDLRNGNDQQAEEHIHRAVAETRAAIPEMGGVLGMDEWIPPAR
jgi:hypothetical protein